MELDSNEESENNCPLCKREIIFKSDHHLIPRTRGGKAKVCICADCHSAIHALFNNKELERTFNSVEALLCEPRVVKMVAFLAKQDPRRRYRARLANNQRKRGRNG